MISKNKLIPLKRLPNFYNISVCISRRNFKLGKKVGPQASCPQPVCLMTVSKTIINRPVPSRLIRQALDFFRTQRLIVNVNIVNHAGEEISGIEVF